MVSPVPMQQHFLLLAVGSCPVKAAPVVVSLVQEEEGELVAVLVVVVLLRVGQALPLSQMSEVDLRVFPMPLTMLPTLATATLSNMLRVVVGALHLWTMNPLPPLPLLNLNGTSRQFQLPLVPHRPRGFQLRRGVFPFGGPPLTLQEQQQPVQPAVVAVLEVVPLHARDEQ